MPEESQLVTKYRETLEDTRHNDVDNEVSNNFIAEVMISILATLERIEEIMIDA